MASLTAIDDEVGSAERELYQAMIARDVPLLRDMLADDLVYMHSNGVAESKEAYVEGVAGGLYEYDAIETRYVQHWSHGNVVVRTGLIRMVVGERDKPKSEAALLFTTLWRREGRWRLVLRQTTRAPGH